MKDKSSILLRIHFALPVAAKVALCNMALNKLANLH